MKASTSVALEEYPGFSDPQKGHIKVVNAGPTEEQRGALQRAPDGSRSEGQHLTPVWKKKKKKRGKAKKAKS